MVPLPIRIALTIGLLIGAACASPPPPETAPAPASAPARPAPVVPAEPRRDTVPAPRASAPPADRRPAAATPPPRAVKKVPVPKSAPARIARVRASRVPVARLSARNDTLPVRTLRAPVDVCAGGDVTLGTNLFPEWSREASARMRDSLGLRDDPASLLAPLAPFVKESDVLLLNIESAIGAGDTPSKCGPRSTNCFAFRSPLSAAPALRALTSGALVGNIANNHARDAGDDGVDSTVAALSRAGIRVTGNDTLATAVRTPAGDSIGVLGFYTSKDTPDARDTAAVYRHVARATRQFPVVIVTMHLGAEGRGAQRTLDARELYLRIDRGNPVAFADAAVRGGATMVIGHGPHVLRGVEWRKRGALIAYSLGNLLTYGPFRLKEPLNRGAVLCTTIDTTGRVSEAAIASTRQAAPGVLARDVESRAVTLVDSLSRLDFPRSGVHADPDGRLIPMAIGQAH